MLRVHDACIAQLLEVMTEGGLRDVEQRQELADADLASVPKQDVDELESHGVAECLGDLCEACRAGAIRVHDRLATALTCCALALRGQRKIDGHR
jgi:hypothetical protein